VYENYAAGINKVASNVQMWPFEFYLLWVDFEPFTVKDAI
jgi:hypothetical protein